MSDQTTSSTANHDFTTKAVVIYGASGTGKTRLSPHFMDYFGKSELWDDLARDKCKILDKRWLGLTILSLDALSKFGNIIPISIDQAIIEAEIDTDTVAPDVPPDQRYCVNCQFVRIGMKAPSCKSPATLNRDPVYGLLEQNCSKARNSGEACGPQGMLFVPSLNRTGD